MNAPRPQVDLESPEALYAELFTAVQEGRLLEDSKTFVDATPDGSPAAVLARYRAEVARDDFDLRAFVERNFHLPEPAARGFAADPQRPVRDHIDRLWDALSRVDSKPEPHSSRIALPRPYIVPGGRFREIYYWDSYFSMLGLEAAGRVQQIDDMVRNFAFLIDSVGFVPNGNRRYFCSRSQPPFFALMVELLAKLRDDDGLIARYLPQLEAEHEFWMRGGRACRLGNVGVNRYWDDAPSPRPESHAEDVEAQAGSGRDAASLYRDIRAACESGWDFSSRWLDESGTMAGICTTGVVPVDLNCLLHELERVIAAGHRQQGNAAAGHYERLMAGRATLIQQRFFNDAEGLFCDLHLPDGRFSPALTLATVLPLYCGIASPDQARSVADRLRRDFLQAGGWQTSLAVSGQQWDAPSGWAPLQWLCYAGLRRYEFEADAQAGAARWVDNNLDVYRQTGLLMERYDVVNIGRSAVGGEYLVQDGFGWTNGVLLRLMNDLGV